MNANDEIHITVAELTRAHEHIHAHTLLEHHTVASVALAPDASRVLTTTSCPLPLASISGVVPSS